MAEEFSAITFVAVLVVLVVFAWLIKLSYDLKKAMATGFSNVDMKVGELENVAVELKQELGSLQQNLSDKLDKTDLDSKITNLLNSIKNRKK